MEQPGWILVCWALTATFAPILTGNGSDTLQRQNVLPHPVLAGSREAGYISVEKEDSLDYKPHVTF